MNKLIEDLIQIFRDYHEEVNRHDWIMEGISGDERVQYLTKLFEKQENKFLVENIAEVLNNHGVNLENRG